MLPPEPPAARDWDTMGTRSSPHRRHDAPRILRIS
ncbi:Protein of unknown function [Gryllus bimaculatus]|nr:Protein of unknown function [Gryllus bimaculatus]